jgi:hypothetical protein
MQFRAVVGARVTVRVIADNTKLVEAEYSGLPLPVANNGVTFAVVPGSNLLSLNLTGPPEDVEIVEDCGGGNTQHMGYTDDAHPVLAFNIVGGDVIVPDRD